MQSLGPLYGWFRCVGASGSGAWADPAAQVGAQWQLAIQLLREMRLAGLGCAVMPNVVVP